MRGWVARRAARRARRRAWLRRARLLLLLRLLRLLRLLLRLLRLLLLLLRLLLLLPLLLWRGGGARLASDRRRGCSRRWPRRSHRAWPRRLRRPRLLHRRPVESDHLLVLEYLEVPVAQLKIRVAADARLVAGLREAVAADVRLRRPWHDAALSLHHLPLM